MADIVHVVQLNLLVESVSSLSSCTGCLAQCRRGPRGPILAHAPTARVPGKGE